ncbi:MAG: carbonic anhydrase [Phycisphaerales bacterium]|nr:carbonic anhydrase [Phycisphaerales bacterium]
MSGIEELLANNVKWRNEKERAHPGFFQKLATQQKPRFLWIGCADSRVPANEIVDLPPGEVFVHRNIANLVVHSDLNCLSVLDFAINTLEISDVIVCGHYGCGGVAAALTTEPTISLVEHWVRHVRDIAKFYRDEINKQPCDLTKARRLCEINVAVQVVHVRENPLMEDACKKREIRVHGLIYDVADGLLHNLTHTVEDLRAHVPSRGIGGV